MASDGRGAPGPVGFSGLTDTVLVFDDGSEGALALDLDSGDQQRFGLPGQRAGDQPYRLHRMGGWLVVGWGEISAVAPGTELPARPLGQATVFLPAAEPDQLWLIDDDAGSISGGFAATLIDASGEPVTSPVALGGEFQPLRGVPGGLALRRDSGILSRWDPDAGRINDYLSDGPAEIADATRDRVAWCQVTSCRGLHVATGDGKLVATLDPDATFQPDEAWLSPDGSRVAAAVAVSAGQGGVDRRLRVYDTTSGAQLADTQLPLGWTRGGWSLDGRQFFAWLSSPGAEGAPALLGRWDGGDTVELVDVSSLGLVGVYEFVTMPRVAAAGIFAHIVGEPCPVSTESHAMGPLPAWQGERVHVALPRSFSTDVPDQLWVGIPGAGGSAGPDLSVERLDGPGLARFQRLGGGRTSAGYPPHWAFEAEFSDPGCWAVTVTTGDGISDTVVVDLAFDPS